MKRYIYADNAATTKLDTEAFEAMLPWLTENYGNASQPYFFGKKAAHAIKEARQTIAALTQIQIIFFSPPVERKVITGQLNVLEHPQRMQKLLWFLRLSIMLYCMRAKINQTPL